MNHITYTYHQDPGHGWLEVPKAEIERLGIAAEISHYSYQRSGTVYLEEDCDLKKFIDAMKEQRNWTFLEQNIKSSHTDRSSKIRNYEMYEKEIA